MISDWPMRGVDDVRRTESDGLATGPFGSSVSSKFFCSAGVPLIRGSNLSTEVGERLVERNYVFVSEEKASQFARATVGLGDLVFTCWGTIGQVGLVDDRARFGRYLVSNKQMKLSPDPTKADSLFLYYLFSSPTVQGSIQNMSIGSSVPGFNLGQLRNIRFPLPSLSEQRAIASVLGALDDKIEQNRRTAQALEKLARAIFRAWFVDFEPIKAKAAGATSVPSMPQPVFDALPTRFVDSDIGPVPEGWDVGQLGDIVVIHDHQRVPLSRREREKRRGSFRYYGATGILDWVDDYLFDGTFVLVGEDGTVIDERDGPVVQYVWGKFWVNNHAHVLTGVDGISVEYVKTLLEHVNIRPFITGAVQLKLNQGNMKAVPVVIPNERVVIAFDECTNPLFSLIRQLHNESIALAAMRDYLLPKLLSGQIRVRAAERAAATVA